MSLFSRLSSRAREPKRAMPVTLSLAKAGLIRRNSSMSCARAMYLPSVLLSLMGTV
jgi:hypothetical protein